MSKFGPGKKGTQASIQYHDECMQSIKDCEGQPSCSFARCQPGLLQLSCIEDLYFQTTKVRTAQCPEGMLLRVKLAEAGSGIKSFDASKETVLQQQCPVGSNSCTFDFSKFKEYKGQALRVEYVCECPKGYSPLPATDPRNPSGAGACVRCMPGTYRTETDAACMLCPPGTYSGVVQRGEECVPCPAGTYAATAGQSTCNVCGQGTYSAPGAAICRPCTGNTYQDSMGAAACEPCAPGFFVPPSNYSRLACDACPTGTYRSAALAVCTPCAVGSMANTTGMGQCTACPAGYYSSSTGQAACSPCPIGTYQDKTGQAGCVACAKGYYTAKSASTAAAACSLKDAPIDYDALAVQVALQYAQGRTVTTRVATNRNAKNRKPVTGRGLLQITAPATPSELAAAKTQTLTYNATICQAMLRALGAATGLTELGNGICNGGPFNTAVCGWDRGDCCEATCNPNKDMAFSCAATNMQCRDPTVIARAARGGYASVLDCTLPGSQQKTPEPANAPATCPAAAGQGGRGNGVCDDDLNIAACNYDDGDCCPSTCKRSYIDISCSPDLFNCRDKAANTDTVPPTLWGVPMPADEVFFKTFSSLQRTSALEPTSEVSASDNYPCFDGVVTVTDVNIALTSKTAAQCNDKVLFNIKRTWSAKDAAGNVATATRTYSIVDDQDSIMIGNIMVPVASPTSALPFARQTLSLGTTAPNKIYTWTLTPRPGVSGKVVTKTGGTVSVTISNTASTGAELVATATGNSVYDVTVRTAYAGCVAPVTTIKVGTLTVMVTGQPLAALSPASASIRLSGSVTFVASQSLNPNAGTGSGITYAWVVRNAAGTAVITKPASATLSQLNILGTQLGQTRAPTTAVAFNVTVTIVTVTGQSATAAASLTLTA
ncbi:hypothetical protein OEZ86_012700 [Tetradesmus obliquus]|nr:hypothetical protein OEZ86_012700 [Tetradesmus obliquus]